MLGLVQRWGEVFPRWMIGLSGRRVPIALLRPSDLAIAYPPASWEPWQSVGSFLLILAISLLALWSARRRPYLTVGWLWFVGALVPVIGVVQVGLPSMADRYAYFPSIGLFVTATWGSCHVLQRWHGGRRLLGPGGNRHRQKQGGGDKGEAHNNFPPRGPGLQAPFRVRKLRIARKTALADSSRERVT